ncbi:MAG TPA: LamG domain-containing protein [Ferruginibacter sp.]|nr:LamG domain-containing protein [Ferruginibacter sp.]
MKRSIFILLLLSNACFAQVDLQKGLKAYFPFSGNDKDASGNNNDPAYNNATLTTDRFNNPNSAYHFNGRNNYMRIPNSRSLNFGKTMTLTAWVRPTGFYAGPCHGNAVMKGDDDYLQGNYFMRFDDNYFLKGNNCNTSVDPFHQCFYGTDVGSYSSGKATYIKSGQWYCVVVVSNGAMSTIFIDGQLTSSRPSSLSLTNSYDLFFGRLNNPRFPYWFNGDLDEVRIYDRALNVGEILRLCDRPNIIKKQAENNLKANASGTPIRCDNWLHLTQQPAYADIGDLDISGDQLTIECTANRSSFFSNGEETESDLVSKHTDESNVNYTLRPRYALITTTHGFFTTPLACQIKLNKTYHYAMVYDGKTLKFYRNGFLMSQTKVSGKLVTNNWNTMIGWIPSKYNNENFIGYINEVRIWKVARTQAEIRANMSTSLPDPSAQKGLLAYYTFDNLKNKQGNSNWDGSLGGNASIKVKNPSCGLIADSCEVHLPQYVKRIKKQKTNDVDPASDISYLPVKVIRDTKIDEPDTTANATIQNGIYSNEISEDLSASKGKVNVLAQEKLEQRPNELIKEIEVDHDAVSISVYDNGEIDGDSVTLIYNDSVLIRHLRLTDKATTFSIKIAAGNQENELVMYAENLGSIPPNTALMVINDGEKRYELNISSSKTSNGAVYFRLRH